MPRSHTRSGIDADVYALIRKHAKPLEDTPNSVLRRLLRLDPPAPAQSVKTKKEVGNGADAATAKAPFISEPTAVGRRR